ncbi:MAG: cupin domain-containing protein [Pseudomonadota bacterium]
MTGIDLNSRIVRYGDLKPCKTAFIDAHTPGSDQKENFTIIGGGVSESADQHVHIAETPGFNIGAAGQPPICKNSLHSHTTAEVFFVLKGSWEFYWGRWGDAGRVRLEEGDIINIPTGIFRGFQNVGNDYGMVMAILGGDDAGGGVTWAPQVIENASGHGLILGDNGKLYDTKEGEKLPAGVKPMPVLTVEELKAYPEPANAEVVPNHVARYWDMMAMAAGQPAKVIGEHSMLRDKPGFEVELIRDGSLPCDGYTTRRHEVLMIMRGHWTVSVDGHDFTLAPGDTFAVPPNANRAIAPAMTGEASMFIVRNTDDPAGPTWKPS